jgi:hypothetical protein
MGVQCAKRWRSTPAGSSGRLKQPERSIADVGVQLADHSVRIDRVNAHLDCLDKQLGLARLRTLPGNDKRKVAGIQYGANSESDLTTSAAQPV